MKHDNRIAKAKRHRLVRLLAIALAIIPCALFGAYQYYVSGYPAANESCPTASAGIGLVTSTCARPSSASAIEARYRTWDESDGIALRSDKYRALAIIIK